MTLDFIVDTAFAGSEGVFINYRGLIVKGTERAIFTLRENKVSLRKKCNHSKTSELENISD